MSNNTISSETDALIRGLIQEAQTLGKKLDNLLSKFPCPVCQGLGRVYYGRSFYEYTVCTKCGGSGKT